MAKYTDNRMREAILPRLGVALRHERQRRGLNKKDLAARVGRPTPRISELETDLLNNRSGRDRLALLAEVCDALDLTLLAVPQHVVSRIEAVLETAPRVNPHPDQAALFDELFVDLSDEPAAERPTLRRTRRRPN